MQLLPASPWPFDQTDTWRVFHADVESQEEDYSVLNW